jgi:Protoglobin
MSKMQRISPDSITQHLPSRISYLHSFLSFHPAIDGALINSTKPLLLPLLPHLLDAVYTHLLNYDITARSFLPAQQALSPSDRSGGINEKDVRSLSLDHANIKHRQDFLRAYLARVLNNRDWSPESRIWEYLDSVGRVHTGKGVTRKSGQRLRVEYIHVAALMGWLQDQITGVVMGYEEEVKSERKEGEGEEVVMWTAEKKTEVLRAWGRFWWVQNDLFARRYVEDVEEKWEGRLERRNELDVPLMQVVVVGLMGMLIGAMIAALLLT